MRATEVVEPSSALFIHHQSTMSHNSLTNISMPREQSGERAPRYSVLQGNCTKVLRTIPSNSIDLVVTDPPYLVRYTDRDKRTIANDTADASARVLGAFADIHRVLKPDTLCISFYGWQKADAFLAAWRSAGFTPVAHLTFAKRYAS